jgi:hypothetical protein
MGLLSRLAGRHDFAPKLCSDFMLASQLGSVRYRTHVVRTPARNEAIGKLSLGSLVPSSNG